MSNLIFQDNQIQTMSSLDFLNDVINPAREAEGEKPVENRHFIARVEDELDDLPVVKFFRPSRGGTPQKFYDLTFDQMTLVGMRESKAVRRNVLARLKELQRQVREPHLPDFSNPVAAARAWADECEQKQIAQAQIALQHQEIEKLKPIAAVGERVVEHKRAVVRIARTLPGVNTRKVQARLAELDYLYPAGDGWRVNRKYTRLFKERPTNGPKGSIQVIATDEGQKLLYQLYNDNQLPMKKGRAPQESMFDLTGSD